MENISLIIEALGAYFCGFMFYIIAPIITVASMIWLVISDWK